MYYNVIHSDRFVKSQFGWALPVTVPIQKMVVVPI
jgi:hypothetical protein